MPGRRERDGRPGRHQRVRARRALRRPGVTAALVLALLGAGAGAGVAFAPATASAAEPRVLVLGVPAPRSSASGPASGLTAELADRRAAIGLLNTVQGAPDATQQLLDTGSGTRTSRSAYRPRAVPALRLQATPGGGARVRGWAAAAARARTAPQTVAPGRLGGLVAGGAVAVTDEDPEGSLAALAADRGGRIARLSTGTDTSVGARALAALARHRLVVADLPPGAVGDAAVRTLTGSRSSGPASMPPPGTLVIVLGGSPPGQARRLTPIAVLPTRPGDGTAPTLTSATTRLDGLVAAIDVLPTVARHLRTPVPAGVRGEPIEMVRDAARPSGRTAGGSGAALDGAAARDRLAARLTAVQGRRAPVLGAVALGWVALLGVAAVRRRGRAPRVRGAVRIGALGLLWTPAVLLVGAAVAPGVLVEALGTAVLALGLGAVTDRLLPWPRGPAVPGLVGVVAYTADLALGSPLIVRSVLGPNPAAGSRFYGLGNELEATLPVLALLALAAMLVARPRSRPLAGAFAVAGVVLLAITGSGRLGADVGGVFTVGAGFAVATLLALPGAPTRGRVALAACAPLLGLVALAALDLLTAGDGHFTRFVLEAGGPGELVDTVRRRLGLALRTLADPVVAVLTVVALAAIVLGVRRRERLLGGLPEPAAWRSALAGGAAAGVLGALTNDSGPLLLLFAVGFAAVGAAYLAGAPRTAATPPSLGGDRRG